MLPTNQLQLKSYLFWGIIFGLLALAFLIVMPFMIAILSAYLLAYMARPLFLALAKKMPSNIAAITCVLVAILLVVVPGGLVIMGIVDQAGDAVSKQSIARDIRLITAHPMLKGLSLNAIQLQATFDDFVSTTTASVLGSLPNLMIGLFITLIGMYYILSSWESISAELRKHIPSTNKDRIIRNLETTTRAILYGTLAMAILEFAVSLIGFSLLGVESGIILASIIFILAFVPSIGPILVWAPLAIYYASIQSYFVAAGIFFIGLILTVGIETVLYANWIGDRAKIHPLVMIVGVIGGISLFGIFGFIFGPLILASAMNVVKSAMHSEE